MSEYAFLIAIAAALLGGAMSPGPSFLVVAQNSLSKSRLHGLLSSVGTGLGAAVFALLAALGVTALLDQTPAAYFAFRVIGGLYLLWLAYLIWRGATQPLLHNDQQSAGYSGLFGSLVKGFVVQISNPKTIFIIASIFSALMPAQPPVNTAVYVALIAFVVDFGWYAIVAFSLSESRSRDFYQRTKVYFDRFAAGLLLLLSSKLFFELLVN